MAARERAGEATITAEREPRNIWWRHGLMAEANVLAICLLRLGCMAQGIAAATLAWDTLQALARDEGEQSKWARTPTRSLIALHYGWALLASGCARKAVAVLAPALDHWRGERASTPIAGRRRCNNTYRRRSRRWRRAMDEQLNAQVANGGMAEQPSGNWRTGLPCTLSR